MRHKYHRPDTTGRPDKNKFRNYITKLVDEVTYSHLKDKMAIIQIGIECMSSIMIEAYRSENRF